MTDMPSNRTPLQKGYRWPKDRYGQEFEVGDFISYINYSSDASVHFGSVVRVTKTGNIEASNIRLDAKDKIVTTLIKKPGTAVILGPEIKAAVMLRKLSME